MRRPTLPLAATLAAALVVPPAHAQHAHPTAGTGETARTAPDRPPIPLTSTDRIAVEHHPEERTVELVVGPVELTDGMPHLRLPVQVAVLPTSGWIRGFEWRIVDGRDERLPDELLHHVNLVDPDRRQLFAPTSLRVLAAGRETRRAMLPPVMGIPFREGDRLLVSAMFANATGAGHPDARLRVRIHYLAEGDRLVRPHDVFPFYLDVTGPVGDKGFPVPPGRTVKAWEGSPAAPARILGAGGHLHDHAERIRLVDLTADRVLWSAEPNAAGDGRVFSVPEGRFWWGGGIPLRPARRYRVEVVYRNPGDGPSPLGGMGVVAGVVLPADADAWPPLDRSDRAYCLDLMHHVTEPVRSAGHADGGHGHGDSPAGTRPYADAPCRAAFGPQAGFDVRPPRVRGGTTVAPALPTRAGRGRAAPGPERRALIDGRTRTMGEFLERIQSASPAEDPDRTLEAVRGIFYAMMQGTEETGCREVADLLPEELETLWKPALFTCLREHRSSDAPPADASFAERVRRHAPDLEEEEIERLTRAVLDALAPRLSGEARDRLFRAAPPEAVSDATG